MVCLELNFLAFCLSSTFFSSASMSLAVWKRLMGKHYPAMSMIFVSDLLDSPGKIELEATAVVPQEK